jgi:hypothetical protein
MVRNIGVILEGTSGTSHTLDIDATLVSEFRNGTEHYISMRPNGEGVALPIRAAVKSVRIQLGNAMPTGSKAIIRDISLRYRTEQLSHWLFRDHHIDREVSHFTPISIATELDAVELRDPRVHDRELEQHLVTHLNEHIEYYHRAIWWEMDAEKRYMMLDGFQAPHADGRSVASVVENRLIGIIGNCLVMPVSRGFHLDPTHKLQSQSDLIAHYEPTTAVEPVRISLPVRGVFAETVVGNSTFREEGEPVTGVGSVASLSQRLHDLELGIGGHQFGNSTRTGAVTVPGTSTVTVPGSSIITGRGTQIAGYTVPSTTGFTTNGSTNGGGTTSFVTTLGDGGIPTTGLSQIQAVTNIPQNGLTVTPEGLLIRKSHTSLTTAEWTAFKEAITKLKRARGTNNYKSFVDAYAATFKAHTPPWGVRTISPDNGVNFLAWHREFLASFETALGMPIPCWNWEISPEIPMEMSKSADLKTWGVTRKVGMTGNIPSGLVRTILRDELDRRNWTVFQQRVEFELHNPLSLFVGGQMASPADAVGDPIFWMHHAFLDKVWAEFQILSGRTVNPANGSERLEPAPIVTRNVGEVLNTFNLGYTYEALPFVGVQTVMPNVELTPSFMS